jgi:MFS family permease
VMDRGVWWRLAILLALVYAVQGAWYPLLSVHLDDLGFSGRARGLIFATMAVGSIAAPLGVGRLADRRYSIEQLLSVFYVIGAALLAAIALAGHTGPFLLFILFQAYWLVIAPSLSLSTALTLRNLPRPADQFGGVRSIGTAGWMVAGWIVSLIMTVGGTQWIGQGAATGFWFAVALSLILASLARFGLPHTPPLADAAEPAGLRARWHSSISLLKTPGIAPYLLTAFGVALTVPYMYQVIPNYLVAKGLQRQWIAPVMSLGQTLEVIGLACFPWLIRRFGFAVTLGLGILFWILRYGQLASDPPLWQAIAGTLLHGLAMACFNIAGQMYLDHCAPPHRRAETQALQTVVTSGAGLFVGSLLAGEAAAGDPADVTIFRLPLLIDVASLVLWILVARTPRKVARELEPDLSVA